jgi:hypothetical protein
MKKLLGLLSAASLIATTGASVVSCGFVSRTSNSDDTNGNDKKDDWSKSLNRVITETYLGNLAEKQYKDKDFILNKTLEKNPGLDINELVVTNNGPVGATISAKEGSKIYTGFVPVSYNFDRDYTELSDVITNPDLGHILNNSSDCILAKIKEMYPDLNINLLSARPSSFNNSAIILVKSPVNDSFLTGEVTVTFLLPEELKDATDTNTLVWGRIEDSTDETLRKHLKDDIVNLQMDQIEIIVDSKTSATIKAIEGSLVYKGQITVYFVTEVIDLTEVFPEDDRDMGILVLEGDDLAERLLSCSEINAHKFGHYYMEELKAVDVTDTQVTIQANEDSQIYKGEVTLTYTRDPRTWLRNDLVVRDLGELPDDNDETIWNKLQELNPNLRIDELVILSKVPHSAWLTVKENSEVYFPTGTSEAGLIMYTIAE